MTRQRTGEAAGEIHLLKISTIYCAVIPANLMDIMVARVT